MDTPITRHFVNVAGRFGARQVHYRRAGKGPALVLLHQSPQSSREYEPLIRQWSEHFTVIAPDTPGYGQSAALGMDPANMEDFAAALVEFADAIGLRRFAIYGYHTGGGLAVAVAHAAPDRITAAAVNGLAALDRDELEPLLAHYLPHWRPTWDGGHMAWLWSRLREQTVFFPWFDHTRAARMDRAMHAPGQLQAAVLEFLHAGDAYRIAYRAAFTYDPRPVLPQIEVPLLVTAARDDPLAAYLSRLDARADGVKVETSADHAAALDRALEHLLNYPGDVPPAAAPFAPPGTGGWAAMLDTVSGQARLVGTGPGMAGLVLHDAGESADAVVGVAAALEAAAMDLPGHAESGQPVPAGGLDAWAGAIVDALAALPAANPVLAGVGAGAQVALAAARAAPGAIGTLVLVDPLVAGADLRSRWLAEGVPSLEPDWDGGHLLRAWHLVRDGRLYFPWFRRDRTGIRWNEPRLDPAELTDRVRERLQADGAWQALTRAALDAGPPAPPAGLRVVVALRADGPDPEGARRFADSIEGAVRVELDADPAHWGERLAGIVSASPTAG